MDAAAPAACEIGQTADESEEISKKDVLRQTGLSYGQFYRWKRMGLIPEAWFRHRATFTGQEAFLPRRKLLERIATIQQLRERHSLEEIALLLSPDAAARSYSRAEVTAMSWISPRARSRFPGYGDHPVFFFLDLVCLRAIDYMLSRDGLADDRIAIAAQALLERFAELPDGAVDRHLLVAEKDGTALALLHTDACLFDRAVQITASIDLDPLIEEVRVRLRDATD